MRKAITGPSTVSSAAPSTTGWSTDVEIVTMWSGHRWHEICQGIDFTKLIFGRKIFGLLFILKFLINFNPKIAYKVSLTIADINREF
jgi:hypothetical protein